MTGVGEAGLLTGFRPVADEGCRILILGSFPGEASLRAGNYYAHPSNQFWPIVSAALGRDLGAEPFDARYKILRHHGLGLWDVIGHCRRDGSLDSRIREARLAGVRELVARLPRLERVLCNGATAGRHAASLQWPEGVLRMTLPSTSAAFAAMPAAEKRRRWLCALRPTPDDAGAA